MNLENAQIISNLTHRNNYKLLKELIAEREALSAQKLLGVDLSTREAQVLQIKAVALSQVLKQIEEEAESVVEQHSQSEGKPHIMSVRRELV